MLLLLLGCSLGPEEPVRPESLLGGRAPETVESDDRNNRNSETEGEEAVEEASVRWLSPQEGEVVLNPVTFVVEAEGVSELEVYADEWHLGSLLPTGELTYTFSGVDTPRVITIEARDSDGNRIPTETLTIVPTNGEPEDGFTPVPYFYQYNNAYSPSATCGNTSAAMLLGARGSSATPDDLTLAYGKGQGQSPESLASMYQWEGYQADYGRTGTRSQLKRLLDDGDPVVVHGFWTGPGHIAVLVGYDENGWIANDPAGDWYLGYGSSSGKGVHYPFGGGWDDRLSYDGDIWWSTAR